MKRLTLLLFLLVVALLVACQAQSPALEATATSAPTAEVAVPTEATATATTAPASIATEAAPPATETSAPPTETAPAATATTEAPPAAGILCPEIARPVAAFFIPGEGYLVADPLSGDTCQATLEDTPGMFQASPGAVYYTVNENEQFIVKRVTDSGAELLPFTAVPVADAVAYHSFVVSPDGSAIAWGAAAPAADNAANTVSQIWVADISSGDAITPLPPYVGEEQGGRRVMAPVRFSDDNSVLYYTLQPYGIGGAWSSFVGRYDNLYALRLGTEAPPELIFDCASVSALLCLGDFSVLGGHVNGLAYVDTDNNVVVENGAGDVLNTLSVEGGYVAYPTWGPSGELVFYAADIEDSGGPPQPATATIYRVAPPTAPAEAIASDPNLLPPNAWVDDSRFIAGYIFDDSWGSATVGIDGSVQPLQDTAGTTFVAVLPPAGAAPGPNALGEVTLYRDEVAGVALLYPSGWSIIDLDATAKEESAAYAVSFFSWQPETAGQGGIPEGGTKFDLVVVSDTAATSFAEAVAERRDQMAAMDPPESILAEEELRLPSGLEVVRWLVESRGEQAVVYLTYVDGRAIMVSGLGNFDLIDSIARTLEPLS